MSVIIKNPTTEAKIRKLARRTGETLTAAVERAVEERLTRLPQPKKKGRLDRRKLARILSYFDSLPKTNEHLSDDEIIGYEKFALPKSPSRLQPS